MKISISQILIMALAALMLCSLSVRGSDETSGIKKVPAHPTVSVSGQDLFREYCAVCHGTNAKGEGPAAAALRAKPANLTQIARRNGNKYPEVKVQRIINGEDEVTAHGSRDMPVWGEIFRHMSSNQ